MRKIDRLFEIVQLLRGKRLRTAEFMANELGVSARTIYRDIQGLMASGVPIEGERGVGYIIQQSIELPPLKFTHLELKALQLGINMVAAVTDDALAKAANEAAIKIKESLPNRAFNDREPAAHIYFESDDKTRESLFALRTAMDERKKLKLTYSDRHQNLTERVVRPLGLEYWGKVWTLTAWCDHRNDFRVFRVDQINSFSIPGACFENEAGKTYRDYLDQIEFPQ